MLWRSSSDQEFLQTITARTRMPLITLHAAFILVAVTNCSPAAYNSDCVAQSSAVRFVIARTLACLNIMVLRTILPLL
jgi:hypothetical protein